MRSPPGRGRNGKGGTPNIQETKGFLWPFSPFLPFRGVRYTPLNTAQLNAPLLPFCLCFFLRGNGGNGSENTQIAGVLAFLPGRTAAGTGGTICHRVGTTIPSHPAFKKGVGRALNMQPHYL